MTLSAHVSKKQKCLQALNILFGLESFYYLLSFKLISFYLLPLTQPLSIQTKLELLGNCHYYSACFSFVFSSTPTRSLLLIPEHPSDFILLVIASEIISIIPTGYFNSMCESESVSRSVVSHSLRPHGLQPARLLSPWDSAGKNTGVGCHSIQVLYHLSHQGRSFLIMIPSMKFS